MSAWRILVKRLYAAGGGPLPRAAFDPMDNTLGTNRVHTLDYAKRHGLVSARRRAYFWEWQLTQRGIDWCEGRIAIEATRDKRGQKGEDRPRATWLLALPRPEQVAAT